MFGRNRLARYALGLTVAAVATMLVGCWEVEGGPAFPAEVASKLDETVRKQMDAGLIPGALVAIHDPEHGTLVKAYGVADLASGRPMQVTDHVRIGSVTKTFTATAVLKAADEGKLSLDDPLEKYVPGVPNGQTITLRDLLGMRGGVWDLGGDPDYTAQLLSKETGEWQDGARLRLLTTNPDKAQPPRTKTEYSNSEYFLLGLVLEKVTGKPIHEVLDGIATAHGLRETTYPADVTVPSPASRGYSYFDETATDVTARNSPALFGAAGSMVSTVNELAAYAPKLARGDLLKPETNQTRQQFTEGTVEYALGLQRFGPWLGHTGGVLGYSTHVAYLPERRVSVAVVVNQYTVPPTLLQVSASSIWGAIVHQLYPDSLPGNEPDPTTPPPLPTAADLTAQLAQTFDPNVPAAGKTLRIAGEDKDPELLTKLATVFAPYPMTIEVNKVTEFNGDSLLATSISSSAGAKRPIVVPLVAEDNAWRLETGWVCESIIPLGETSPACV
ncbi:serine hydrolase domain-containing protein [Nocardia altamirensis]|uniref:serine hydrolase domain-containing protein n=1 Tax=Nocardia altamirensis TaxID=472158 RepID=UPI0008406347|nr:serine hydrolase domain-containing protein [Nocardia altamirensis]